MLMPLKKRPRAGDRDDAGAHQTSLLASEEGSAFDVDDDDDPGVGNVLARTFDLDPRAHKLDESAEWVHIAKKRSLALLTGQTKEVIWWLTKKAGPFTLPHLPFSPRTGVYEFRIPPSVCQAMKDYLVDERNRDKDGHLFMDGQSWKGYAKYDLVHAEFGCVSRLQEVQAHVHTDAHTPTRLPRRHPCPCPCPSRHLRS